MNCIANLFEFSFTSQVLLFIYLGLFARLKSVRSKVRVKISHSIQVFYRNCTRQCLGYFRVYPDIVSASRLCYSLRFTWK